MPRRPAFSYYFLSRFQLQITPWCFFILLRAERRFRHYFIFSTLSPAMAALSLRLIEYSHWPFSQILLKPLIHYYWLLTYWPLYLADIILIADIFILIEEYFEYWIFAEKADITEYFQLQPDIEAIVLNIDYCFSRYASQPYFASSPLYQLLSPAIRHRYDYGRAAWLAVCTSQPLRRDSIVRIHCTPADITPMRYAISSHNEMYYAGAPLPLNSHLVAFTADYYFQPLTQPLFSAITCWYCIDYCIADKSCSHHIDNSNITISFIFIFENMLQY